MMPPGSDTSIEEVLASLDTVKAELRKASLEVKPSKASLYTGMEPPVSKASMDFNVHEVLASLDTVKAELLNASLGVNPTLDKDKATLYTLEPPGSKTSMDQHIQEVLESLDSTEWGRLRASFPKNQSDPGSEQAMEMLVAAGSASTCKTGPDMNFKFLAQAQLSGTDPGPLFGTGPGPGPTFCPGPGINFNLFIRNSLTY
eukprot:gene3812-13882_t